MSELVVYIFLWNTSGAVNEIVGGIPYPKFANFATFSDDNCGNISYKE
jgi:hypothetical protein